uniref:SIR2-like domain-containing protein n=1 Tax=Candidatus Kentrum sp. TC TaxID=2126339 RepID=A0A450Z899_9GAMM|nr:MAG: SIR2-like domain-containing protein [Candidatus Kentron sp. TC]
MWRHRTRIHRILAHLPIATAWTTNYDRLLERAFEDAGKVVDLKLTQENLVHTRRGRDVVLYKMHGCVSQSHEAVITKDDYKQYEKTRPLFMESLKGDLIGKTFLFLEFSFTDPNIDYILSRVRILLGKNAREHFCVMRKPQEPSDTDARLKAEYEYEMRKTELRQADLLRFGVETVWVDEFFHIELLLATLSSFVHRKAVFVSGAAHDPAPLGQARLDGLARAIGTRLIAEGYNLVSGFGQGLGEQCVIGTLRRLYGIPRGEDLERCLSSKLSGNIQH